MADKSARLWPLRYKLFSVLILIVFAVAGFFVYQKIALELNRRGFQQARSAIDTVYGDIVAKVGPPDNSKSINDCSRPSEEFDQGPLSCSVGADFIYGVSDHNQANNLFRQIQGVIAQHPSLFHLAQALDTSIKDTLVVNTYYHSAQDYYKMGDMDCSIKYSYDTPSNTYLSLKGSDSKKAFYVAIGCSDWAKAQYYPLN
jgi:hypothetical protein